MKSLSIPLDGDVECIDWVKDNLFRSIRSKSLQKLLLLNFSLWVYDTGIKSLIEKRLTDKGYQTNRSDMFYEVTVDEIMQILSCSKRTAQDYQYTLRRLC